MKMYGNADKKMHKKSTFHTILHFSKKINLNTDLWSVKLTEKGTNHSSLTKLHI